MSVARRLDPVAVAGLLLATACALAFMDWLLLARTATLPRDTRGFLPLAGALFSGFKGDHEITQAVRTLLAIASIGGAGLAAWIVEKYRAWGDCVRPDGVRDVEHRFSKDVLLTCVMLYWVTGTIASANRIYAETRRAGAGASLPTSKVPVPMGYARFPGDGFGPVRAWVDRLYDVHRWTVMPEGGHFPALEVPELLVDDVRAFFRPLR